MGLSASQARLLTLTARQHTIEYNAQKLEAQKLQLANDSDEVYNTYLEALDATKIQYKVVDTDGSTSYEDATFTKLAAAGFLFKVGDTICRTYDDIKNALSKQGIVELTASDSYSLVTTLVSEGYVIILQQSDSATSGYEYYYDETEGYIIKYTDPEDGTTETYGLNGTDDDDNYYVYYVFEETSVSTSTKLQEISDEVGLKKAEAQYEADMNKIDAKDAQYDTQLSQLETERDAIQEEIETLKTVASDNVERTFKIFS